MSNYSYQYFYTKFFEQKHQPGIKNKSKHKVILRLIPIIVYIKWDNPGEKSVTSSTPGLIMWPGSHAKELYQRNHTQKWCHSLLCITAARWHHRCQTLLWYYEWILSGRRLKTCVTPVPVCGHVILWFHAHFTLNLTENSWFHFNKTLPFDVSQQVF